VNESIFSTPSKPRVLATQSGKFVKDYSKTNIPLTASGDSRTEKYTVLFDAAFNDEPQITVSVTGIKVKKEVAIFAKALDISIHGFTLEITSVVESDVEYVEVNWLATLPKISEIYSESLRIKEDHF